MYPLEPESDLLQLSRSDYLSAAGQNSILHSALCCHSSLRADWLGRSDTRQWSAFCSHNLHNSAVTVCSPASVFYSQFLAP